MVGESGEIKGKRGERRRDEQEMRIKERERASVDGFLVEKRREGGSERRGEMRGKRRKSENHVREKSVEREGSQKREIVLKVRRDVLLICQSGEDLGRHWI